MQDLDGNCEGLNPMMLNWTAALDPGVQWGSVFGKRIPPYMCPHLKLKLIFRIFSLFSKIYIRSL
jgi:hypothetical protein